MTWEEATMIIKVYLQRLTDSASNQLDGDIEAFNMVVEVMEREPCEDAVSRQAVIDALEKVAELFPWYDTYDRYNEAWNDAIGRAEMEIEGLPSVNPQLKMGRWVIVKDRTDWYDATYECSCCKREIIVPYDARNEVYKDYPYCHCGAKMEES